MPITIATTLAPGANMLNQQKAIDSWLQLGFNVLSVNTAEEIELLSPQFPGIEFIAAKRDARDKYGKPYIYFDDLLEALSRSQSSICGIINSDIQLLQPDFYEFIEREAESSFIFGARIDVPSFDAMEQGNWYRGFDYFFFNKTVISYYPQEEFCIGLPWWDYWAVFIPLVHRIPVKKIIMPFADHVMHTPGYLNTESFVPLGLTLAKYARPNFPLTPDTMYKYLPLMFKYIDQKATAINFYNSHTPISAIVHTLNEEQNIKNCLECLTWADEIIVVDMHSEDKTLEIARQYTDKIFLHERCRYVEPARQFALQQTSHQWVLVVDADEMVPVTLRNTLLQIAGTGLYDVIWIPRLNYLFGHAMQGSGRSANDDCQLRFFKKPFIAYADRIHMSPQVHPNARVHHLCGEEQALVHFNYIDLEHYIEKLNRYTTIEAENNYAAGKIFNLEEVWQRSISEISNIVFHKGGIEKDGDFGVGWGMLMALYHFTAALKLKLINDYNTTQPRNAILDQYQSIADEIIKQHRKD